MRGQVGRVHHLLVEASEMFFKWLKHLYDDYNGFSPN